MMQFSRIGISFVLDSFLMVEGIVTCMYNGIGLIAVNALSIADHLLNFCKKCREHFLLACEVANPASATLAVAFFS